MAEYIGCRKCDSPDCKGCNLKNLETMLNNGKFDCLMNENRCINPSDDVAPVRHGRWEVSTDEWFETDVYTCSKCRESYVLVEGTPKENLWHYCPNCGAKMDIKDGGDNDAVD